MKFRLDDDMMSDNFFEDTRILGIACTLKNYQFCWHIDQLLQIPFQTSADLQIPMEKNRRSYSFTVYEFIHQLTQQEHFLYSNKHEGEFLLPELQHLDFIWLIRDPLHDAEAFSRIQQRIKEIPGVQLVTEVAHDKIKSKDNLQR
ncbi:MAG: hypothetical protein RLZZ520_1094 [Bacteroidota bacterium]|jgi:hypothetical protein